MERAPIRITENLQEIVFLDLTVFIIPDVYEGLQPTFSLTSP